MRNIPKYHATNQLQNGQVLKFDIRNPDQIRQLRNQRGGPGNAGHATQECLIDTMGEIKEGGDKPSSRTQKRTIGKETHDTNRTKKHAYAKENTTAKHGKTDKRKKEKEKENTSAKDNKRPKQNHTGTIAC